MRQDLFKGINKMGEFGCYLLVTDRGIMMCGNDVEARAMLSQIVNQLKEHGIEEDDLKEAFELGLMTNKQRENIMKKKIKDLIENLFEEVEE